MPPTTHRLVIFDKFEKFGSMVQMALMKVLWDYYYAARYIFMMKNPKRLIEQIQQRTVNLKVKSLTRRKW